VVGSNVKGKGGRLSKRSCELYCESRRAGRRQNRLWSRGWVFGEGRVATKMIDFATPEGVGPRYIRHKGRKTLCRNGSVFPGNVPF